VATTRESVHDGIVWLRDLVLVWLRWGVVLGLVFGLFGLALWLTRGEDFGDCGDVPSEQRAALESLGAAADGVAFAAPPRCRRGVFAAEVVVDDDRSSVMVDALGEAGWTARARFLPLSYDLDVRCLRTSRAEWSDLELNVVAGRDGRILRVEARAPGTETPCARVRCASLTTGCARSDVRS
jgi:hypothetical protein